MVDSDHSEREEVDSNPPLTEVLGDSIGTTNKRQREESSEDEKVTVPNKKPRTSMDNEAPTEDAEMVPASELNGSVKSKEAEDDTQSLENGENVGNKSSSAEESNVKDEDMEDEKASKDEGKSDQSVYNNGTTSDNASITAAPNANLDTTNTSEEEEGGEKSLKDDKDNDVTDKNDSTNALVVDGLELKVECASDKEASSSDSEQEKDAKPRPKTVIVTAEPNESELEVSPSDGEKSDGQELSNSVTPKQDTKKEPAQGQKAFKGKSSGSEEESLNSNSDDEDYSPRTKKKMKKSPAGRKAAKATPAKRGRGGRRSAAQREKMKAKEEREEEDDMSLADKVKKTPSVDEKTPRKRSDNKSSGSDSEVESGDDETSATDGKKKQLLNDPEDEKRILSLKKYINAAGINVKSYQELWAGCKTSGAKVQRLKALLEKNGVTGRPSMDKCRKAKKRNLMLRDASELDTSNIISEGRVTRARKNMNNSSKPPAGVVTPVRQREARNTLKRIQSVVDSDDSE